jgi:RNA polymerase sigma-70 factor (ECF subfamily)
MQEEPVTRNSLLVRLRDAGDEAAWQTFVKVYAPLVFRYARRRGLQEADAADAAQDVLRAVARSAAKLEYDPRRGTFRGWLFTLAHHKVYDFYERRRREVRGAADSEIAAQLNEVAAPGDEQEWNAEYQRSLLDWAAQRVRGEFTASTWKAFWQTAVLGHPVKEVCAALGLSPGAVYIAKSRVQARLKKEIEQVEEPD